MCDIATAVHQGEVYFKNRLGAYRRGGMAAFGPTDIDDLIRAMKSRRLHSVVKEHMHRLRCTVDDPLCVESCSRAELAIQREVLARDTGDYSGAYNDLLFDHVIRLRGKALSDFLSGNFEDAQSSGGGSENGLGVFKEMDGLRPDEVMITFLPRCIEIDARGVRKRAEFSELELTDKRKIGTDIEFNRAGNVLLSLARREAFEMKSPEQGITQLNRLFRKVFGWRVTAFHTKRHGTWEPKFDLQRPVDRGHQRRARYDDFVRRGRDETESNSAGDGWMKENGHDW